MAKSGKHERGVRLSEYMTIDEVCDLLQLGKRTVYQLARTGRLIGAAKVGNQWRVNRARLTAWLDAGGELANDEDEGPA